MHLDDMYASEAGSQISEWIKSKGVDKTESLFEKGKAWYLDSCHETQSICSYLTGHKTTTGN